MAGLGGASEHDADDADDARPAAVRVLVVDDERLMRAGLRLMIDGVGGVVVVGEAADGAEAVAAVEALDPDVVLMDVRMPGTSGIEATRRLTDAGARARVVVLTAFETDDHLLQALRAGAVGFLLKDAAPEAVVAAVQDAARGRRLVLAERARAAGRARCDVVRSRPRAGRPGRDGVPGGRAAAGDDAPGVAGGAVRRAGAEQRRDRRRAVPEHDHGEDARDAPVREAHVGNRVQARRPRAGARRPRLTPGRGDPSVSRRRG
nr:response regulator transcription factor [Angustibacter aerolatus]